MTVERNLLPITEFRIVFGPNRLFTELDAYAVSVNIPSINMADLPTPWRSELGYVASNRITYDPLNIKFAVDEKMQIYYDLYRWMYENACAPGGGHGTGPNAFSDISLQILNSSFGKTQEFKFVNSFPTQINSIEFNVQASEVTYAYVDVSFRYDYFEIVGMLESKC